MPKRHKVTNSHAFAGCPQVGMPGQKCVTCRWRQHRWTQKLHLACGRSGHCMDITLYGFVWKCWVNIPNEIAIFHRDNDQQNHWVQWGAQHFQTHPYNYNCIIYLCVFVDTDIKTIQHLLCLGLFFRGLRTLKNIAGIERVQVPRLPPLASLAITEIVGVFPDLCSMSKQNPGLSENRLNP